MNIGQRIIELREKKGWSQYKLFKAAGISQSTLSRIEAGAREPNSATLRRICDALGVSMAEFDEQPPAKHPSGNLVDKFKLQHAARLAAEEGKKALDAEESQIALEEFKRLRNFLVHAPADTDLLAAIIQKAESMPKSEAEQAALAKAKSMTPDQQLAILASMMVKIKNLPESDQKVLGMIIDLLASKSR